MTQIKSHSNITAENAYLHLLHKRCKAE